MPMIRWVAYFATVVLAMPSGTVRSLAPVGRLTAPAHLEDAVFVEWDQIVALTSETADVTNGQKRCFLSAWDIQQKKWLVTKPMDALPPSVSCGRLEYSSSLHRLIIMADSDLLLVSPQTLELERKISVRPNHAGSIQDQGGILYALSEPGHKPVTLTSYRLPTGALAETKELPGLEYSLAAPLRVAAISNEHLAVLQSDAKPLGVPERNSTLMICTRHGGTACNSVSIPMPVANFRVAGNYLLFVSDDFPDNSAKSRSQCIERLSLSTLQIDRHAYCRPDAGVHYSVAILGGNFVLGYSGYGARRGWLDDGMVVSESSSISVWDANSGRLVAVAPLPHGKSFALTSSVIRVDTSGQKRFLFCNPTEGGEILLYDLSSLG